MPSSRGEWSTGAPGATITTFRTALSWAIVTTTTVRYGDYVPVTAIGRAIAIIVMMVGIGLIGTVSATVAAWFVTRPSKSATEPGDVTLIEGGTGIVTTADSQDKLIARLGTLAAQQDEIRAMLQSLRTRRGGSLRWPPNMT